MFAGKRGLVDPMTSEPAELLEGLDLFGLFSPGNRQKILPLLKDQEHAFGDVVMGEGDAAEALYVVVSGRVRILRDGDGGDEVHLSSLGPGETFGEMALLGEGLRTATTRCSEATSLLRLAKDDFLRLCEDDAELRENFGLLVRQRSLLNFFRQFSALGELPRGVQIDLLNALTPARFESGELIVRQGDPPGPMYILRRGKARVFGESSDDEARNLEFLRAGDFFGEMSVLAGQPRSATAQALTACDLLALSGAALKDLMARHPELRAAINERVANLSFKKEARVPLDFFNEMLPAEARAPGKTVLPDDGDGGPGGEVPGDGAEPDDQVFFTRRKRIRKFPFVEQIDEMDCGAASLAMICRYYGRKVSLSRIRQLSHAAFDGVSLKAICKAAGELGLAARAYKVSRRNLDNIALPAIVHWKDNHWIVLYHVGEMHVEVADPAIGRNRIERGDFEADWSGYAALFDYTEAFAEAPEAEAGLAWLARFFRPFRGIFVHVALLATIASALQLMIPVFTQLIVDKVLAENNTALADILVLGMAAALVFMVCSNLLQRYMLSFIALRIDAGILDFLTRRILSLPMSYFNTRRTGDIQRRLQGARQIRDFLVRNGVDGFLATFQIVAYVAIMAVYSPKLCAVFLVTVPFYAGLMMFSSKVLRPLFGKLEESFGTYSSSQIDAIKGIEAVKAAGAEQAFRDHILTEFLRLGRQQFKSNFVIMAYDSAVQAVGLMATILFLWVGAGMVMAGNLSLGAFVAFNTLVAMALGPILSILSVWDELQYSQVLLNRLRDIIESEPEQGEDRSHLLPVGSLQGRVTFRDLGFRYGGLDSSLILQDIDLDVAPGRTVAIVGRSGSGKTTLIKCLAGLLEATQGTILFDGVDMKGINARDLRQHIGMVLQENYMFSETIARNIAFGEMEPDMDRVVRAARIASAHGFIKRLPLEYDTRIGESGLSLSGGQRQRIAIARALYHDPPILVFDEATSALDTESERAIQENIGELLAGRTTFMIAHRLSTVRNADTIIVLENGRLVEQGNHEELMSMRGIYFYLCSQQMGG